MATGATGQLGLALPVQGELSGTWGDTVNNGITQYTNLAIAATLTLTGDGAVTLANTTGDAAASNITSSLTGAGTVTAQFAIVRITGTLTTAKVVTAPSYSKTYTVVNAATGGIVTFKASGQTGVSIAVGESAFVYYNGTDYVKVAGTASGAAGGSNTQVQYNNAGALAGSANLTFDGTDFVLASGGLLDIDGTNAAVAMRIRQTTAGTGTEFTTTITENTGVTFNSSDAGGATARSFIWATAGTEGMRLDSTGLGVGTNAPSSRLEVAGDASPIVKITSTSGPYSQIQSNTAGTLQLMADEGNTGANTSIRFRVDATEQARITSTGAWSFGSSGTATGTSGQVLTSAGSSAPPTWETASGGSTSIGLVRAIAVNCILC